MSVLTTRTLLLTLRVLRAHLGASCCSLAIHHTALLAGENPHHLLRSTPRCCARHPNYHVTSRQGIDCPMHAAFMDATIFYSGMSGPTTYKNVICVFEHNPGKLLRASRMVV